MTEGNTVFAETGCALWQQDSSIAALQAAIGDQSEGRADTKSAGVSIDETDAHGVRIARAMDVVVRNFYRSNAAVLAEWETARHVERAPRRKKTTPEEPPKSSTPNA